MGLLDLFRPSPRMIAARWIAESMMREPEEWKEVAYRTYRRGEVTVHDYQASCQRLWVVVNGEPWKGRPGKIIGKALDNRHALITTIELAKAHA